MRPLSLRIFHVLSVRQRPTSYLSAGITERFEASALLMLTYVTTRSVFELPLAVHRKIECHRRCAPTPFAAWSADIYGLVLDRNVFPFHFTFTSPQRTICMVVMFCMVLFFSSLIVTTGYLSSRSLSTSKTLQNGVLSG